MAERRERMALLSRYAKLHTAHYGQKPEINYNVEQWAADALLESYGIGKCYDVLAFYFDANSRPQWNTFAYKAESIIKSKNLLEEDLKERLERRRLAKEWLSE